MSLPKYVIGLTSILAGLILARVAVHYAYPTRDMSPDQIWHGMPLALKTIVLWGSVLIGYGCWTLSRAFLNRFGRKKRDPNPLTSTTPSASSRSEGAHPVAWAFLVGVGLLLALGVSFIRGVAELGGRPATAEGWGYLTGTTFAPLIFACVGVGIYYATRMGRRTPRRMISALTGWTLLITILGFTGAAGRFGRSPHFPKDEQEFGRMMSQAYKEASGAVPRDQYSKDELQMTMRDMFSDIIQFRQQYKQAEGQFHTLEMRDLYAASSFGDRRSIEETVRQLRNMASVDQQFFSLDSVFAKTEARIQQKNWPERTKRDFLEGMRNSLAQNKQSRLAVYQAEQKWIDASVDVYTFAGSNFSAISVRRNRVVINDQATRETLNQKLRDAVELHQQFLEASMQYDREQATNAKKYGLSPSELGVK
jgi:hypothetical protein